MAQPELPPDFSEFLKLLNARGVSYLIIGGYAVGFHGHPRATADIDIWIPRRTETAQQVVSAIREFGFETPALSAELFLRPDQVIRLGLPPVRIELLTSIAGVEFDACAPRHQDLADLEHLP